MKRIFESLIPPYVEQPFGPEKQHAVYTELAGRWGKATQMVHPWLPYMARIPTGVKSEQQAYVRFRFQREKPGTWDGRAADAAVPIASRQYSGSLLTVGYDYEQEAVSSLFVSWPPENRQWAMALLFSPAPAEGMTAQVLSAWGESEAALVHEVYGSEPIEPTASQVTDFERRVVAAGNYTLRSANV